MRELCHRGVSLFVALTLVVTVVTVVTGLSGCKKKSGPEKIKEGVGQTMEDAGKSIQKGADEATKK